MKNTLPLLLLIFCVIACGKLGAGTDSAANTSPASNAAPAAPVKAVDMPSLIGKTPDEAKKIVGVAPKREVPSLEWSLPQGDLTADYTKEKLSRINFNFKPVTIGDRTISGLESAEKLGDMVGIDMRGKTPGTSFESFDIYEHAIQGKAVKITFHKIAEKFTGVAINLE